MKNYRIRRSRKPLSLITILALVAGGVIILAIGIYWGISSLSNHVTVGPAQVNVLELWNSGSYDEIIANGKEELKNLPLDPGALGFSGFAYFHKGIAEVSVEKKLPLINQSIITLRKALLVTEPSAQSEIHYVLGKAYFHKGKYFADLAVKHLQLAEKLGYTAVDMNEYLGLAYSLVGRYQEASQSFLKAVAKNPSDLLLWTLGQTYFQMQQTANAILYLQQAIQKTKDRGLEQRCHFLLGEIFTKSKQYDLAQNEYQIILGKNPNSADAHFYLGEIALAQADKELARSEWRKAFKIDPLHFNANQRLFN